MFRVVGIAIVGMTCALVAAPAGAVGRQPSPAPFGVVHLPPECLAHRSPKSKRPPRQKKQPQVTTTTTTAPDPSTRAGQIALLGSLIKPKACAFAKEIEGSGYTDQVFTYNLATSSVVVVASQSFPTGFGPDTGAAVLEGQLATSSGIWDKNQQAKFPLALPTFDIEITVPSQLGGQPQTGHYVCPATFMVAIANGQQSSTAAFDAACGGPPPPFAGMTLSVFNQIATGMSYEQVAALVGAPGKLSAETNLGGFDTKIYMWPGAGSVGANANVTFQNDQEISKAQFGLS